MSFYFATARVDIGTCSGIMVVWCITINDGDMFMKKLSLVLALLFCLTLCLSGCSLTSSSDGQSAYELAVEYGFDGTEAEWLESLQGEVVYEYNAYDVAVENGFEGSEAEWLASLVGDTGAAGSVDVTITDSSTNTVYAVSKALSSSVAIVCTVTNGYSSGSGVVYQMEDDSNISYIVTNYHVIYDGDESSSSSGGNVWPGMSSGSNGSSSTVDYIADTIVVYPYGSSTAITATFAGGSIDNDIAVLAVSTQLLEQAGMQAVAVGGSVITGESIYVVGNAQGEGISATSGIVSVYRTSIEMTAIDNDNEINYMSCIQIDAAVNSGNSGGGLFDSEGNWLGVVNAKLVEESVEGMGYAIPVSIAQPLVEKIIIAYEEDNMSSSVSAYRYMLGISTIATSSSAVYDSDTGLIGVCCVVQIYESYSETSGYSGGVTSGSLADSAGLKSGDTMVSATLDSSMLGQEVSIEITQNYQLGELLLWATTEDTLYLTISRDGVEMTLEISFAGATATLIE